jgi:hypothetical protein
MNPNTQQFPLDTRDAALAVLNRAIPSPMSHGTVPSATSSSESVTLPRSPVLPFHLRSNNEPPARRTDPGPSPDICVPRLQSPPRTASPNESSKESVRNYAPAEYVDENETSIQLPGSAAYYKSRIFRHKTAAGNAQVPGKRTPDMQVIDNHKPMDNKAKPKRLVMIFGRTNVRRAHVHNKFNTRLQRSNKRL